MSTEKKGKLVLLLGVSGAGKNTMMRLLLERNPSYVGILSYKTRPLRPGETNGVDYHYMSNEQFQKSIEQGDFLEYAKVHDLYYYGTNKNDIVEGIDQGKILLKEIDIQGIADIAKDHPDIYKNIVSIFLDLSEETMIQRITSRAPISQEELQKRLDSAEVERQGAQQYCSEVISGEGSIEEVYERVDSIIKTYL